jgi:hypothetical protein
MYNECRHIFTSGKRCQSPALQDQDFCYFHQSNRRRPDTSRRSGQPTALVHHLPPLEDADAIQLAISDVVLALAANRIDPRRAQIIIYGLQVASQNNRQRSADRKLPTVREAHAHEDGSLVAPPQQQPDPEDIPEKEVPSLGRILLREAEAMKSGRMAEQQAQEKASASVEQPGAPSFRAVCERGGEQTVDQQSVSLQLPHIQATADLQPAKFHADCAWPTSSNHSQMRVPLGGAIATGFRHDLTGEVRTVEIESEWTATRRERAVMEIAT